MSNIKVYNSNPNLPSADNKYSYTEEQAKEFIKCMKDPIYFAEKYFKIVHVDHGLIPFTLYDYQKEAIKKSGLSRKFIMNASRQCGKTSVATVIVLHFALFNDSKNIAILANKADTAQEILSRIQLAYEYLPHWLKPGVSEWNKRRVTFDNGSSIIAAASSSSAIRGRSISLLYVDEHAFVDNWDEFSAAVLPTISSGTTTRMIFTSTPNGLNHFYDYVQGAKLGTNGFEYLEVPWTAVPGRDEAWKEEVLGGINHDMEKFECEYACAFAGSSGTLISGSALKRLSPVAHLHINQEETYKVFDEPAPNNSYMIIADVSRGKGLDYSAFHVIDVTTIPYVQVATYRNNLITPTDYSEVLYRTGTAYNEASILVEINDIGGQVVDLLNMDFEYEGILYSESAGRAGKRIAVGFSNTVEAGIRTTRPVKAIGCSMLKLLIEQGKLIIKDSQTIKELNTFSKKGSSYEAESGQNDDLVMGLVLFGWLSQDKVFKDLCDSDVMQHFRERTSEEYDEEYTAFGFSFNAADDFEMRDLHNPIRNNFSF